MNNNISKLILIFLIPYKTAIPMLNQDLYRNTHDLASNDSKRNIYQQDDTDTHAEDFVVIPLGCHCGVAWWMREHNIRTFALPFDWCITPYNALYAVINDEFDSYFKRENLVASSAKYWQNSIYDFYNRMSHGPVDASPGAVLDKQFQMIFSHDFSNNHHATINQQYEEQKAKYTRRVKRFFDAMNSNKHVYLIRLHDITKAQTLELYTVLKGKFPLTSFTLIAMGDDPQEFMQDWHIPHIKNIFISKDTVNQMTLGLVFWKQFTDDLKSGIFR